MYNSSNTYIKEEYKINIIKKIIVTALLICLLLITVRTGFAVDDYNIRVNIREEFRKILNLENIHVEVSGEDINIDIRKEKKVSPIKVPVLMYHHLANNNFTNAVISPEKFKDDMMTLKDNNYTPIFLTDLYKYLKGENFTLPEKPIIVTFDDNYYSVYEYAYPVAKKMDIKLNFFVLGWLVGRDSLVFSDTPMTKRFSWEEAKEMQDSGLINLENHTFDLHSFEGKSEGYFNYCGYGLVPFSGENYEEYKVRVSNDMNRMNNLFEKHLDKKPLFVAYPFGRYSEQSEKVLKELGYKSSLTVERGVRKFENLDDLWLIPRLNVNMDLNGIKLIEAIDNLTEK